LCNVDLEKSNLKLSVQSDCYISHVQLKDPEISITIEGKYWYKRLINYRNKPVQLWAFSYAVTSTKWIFTVTSTCKCMMGKELDTVCGLIETHRIKGMLRPDTTTDNDFYKRLKDILFKKYYKTWYISDNLGHSERKLYWDPDTLDGSDELSEAVTGTSQNYVGKEKVLEKKLRHKFLIHFSPGIVDYRRNDGPLMTVHVQDGPNPQLY